MHELPLKSCLSPRPSKIHILCYHKKGGGGRKWKFLIKFSTESNNKGKGGRGAENLKS